MTGGIRSSAIPMLEARRQTQRTTNSPTRKVEMQTVDQEFEGSSLWGAHNQIHDTGSTPSKLIARFASGCHQPAVIKVLVDCVFGRPLGQACSENHV
jgi:hypothetical protein